MLLADKTRPKSLEKLDFHDDITRRLANLASRPDMPHLLFYGPPGGGFIDHFLHFGHHFWCRIFHLNFPEFSVGKKTRIMCLLRAIYGSGVERLKLETKSFKTPSNKTIEISMMGSNYHLGFCFCFIHFFFIYLTYIYILLECCPSDAKNNDVLVIQEVIKEIAGSGLIQTSSNSNIPFKGSFRCI